MPNEPQDSFWWKLINLDPALVRGVVIAVVALLGTFGILVSDQLSDNLVALLLAILAIVQAVWTKRAVTPNAKVVVRAPDPVNAPDVVAPGEAVTTATSNDIVEAARTSGP